MWRNSDNIQTSSSVHSRNTTFLQSLSLASFRFHQAHRRTKAKNVFEETKNQYPNIFECNFERGCSSVFSLLNFLCAQFKLSIITMIHSGYKAISLETWNRNKMRFRDKYNDSSFVRISNLVRCWSVCFTQKKNVKLMNAEHFSYLIFSDATIHSQKFEWLSKKILQSFIFEC